MSAKKAKSAGDLKQQVEQIAANLGASSDSPAPAPKNNGAGSAMPDFGRLPDADALESQKAELARQAAAKAARQAQYEEWLAKLPENARNAFRILRTAPGTDAAKQAKKALNTALEMPDSVERATNFLVITTEEMKEAIGAGIGIDEIPFSAMVKSIMGTLYFVAADAKESAAPKGFRMYRFQDGGETYRLIYPVFDASENLVRAGFVPAFRGLLERVRVEKKEHDAQRKADYAAFHKSTDDASVAFDGDLADRPECTVIVIIPDEKRKRPDGTEKFLHGGQLKIRVQNDEITLLEAWGHQFFRDWISGLADEQQQDPPLVMYLDQVKRGPVMADVRGEKRLRFEFSADQLQYVKATGRDGVNRLSAILFRLHAGYQGHLKWRVEREERETAAQAAREKATLELDDLVALRKKGLWFGERYRFDRDGKKYFGLWVSIALSKKGGDLQVVEASNPNPFAQSSFTTPFKAGENFDDVSDPALKAFLHTLVNDQKRAAEREKPVLEERDSEGQPDSEQDLRERYPEAFDPENPVNVGIAAEGSSVNGQ